MKTIASTTETHAGGGNAKIQRDEPEEAVDSALKSELRSTSSFELSREQNPSLVFFFSVTYYSLRLCCFENYVHFWFLELFALRD